MCHIFDVSPSGYYHWRKSLCRSGKSENEHLKNASKSCFSRHNCMVGSPTITADLREDPDFLNVSRNRVARPMREMGFKCKTVKKFVVTTDSKHNEPVAPNLLDRQFAVPSPDTVYVSEITYLDGWKKMVLSNCFYRSVFATCCRLGSQ